MTTVDEVRAALEAADIQVIDQKQLEHCEQLRLNNDSSVSVYKSGKVVPQGKNKAETEAALANVGDVVSSGPGNRVFVVYGRNEHAKAQLEAMLRRWLLDPIFLDQLPAGGTLIDKLEKNTSNTRFAVVLASADDVAIADDGETREYRARQNVVLELGMMLAKLGQANVAILLEDKVGMKKPSDIEGLEYISWKDAVKDADVGLAKMMKGRGYNIDVSNL